MPLPLLVDAIAGKKKKKTPLVMLKKGKMNTYIDIYNWKQRANRKLSVQVSSPDNIKLQIQFKEYEHERNEDEA